MPTVAFAEVFMYTFIIVCSTVVHIYYFLRGANTTTIILCAGQLWYKIYSVAIALLMTIVLVLSKRIPPHSTTSVVGGICVIVLGGKWKITRLSLI